MFEACRPPFHSLPLLLAGWHSASIYSILRIHLPTFRRPPPLALLSLPSCDARWALRRGEPITTWTHLKHTTRCAPSPAAPPLTTLL
ncbi:hypothetical protein O3P69_015958 [Scylla paramamosain]|uniref:Secreted protein n=1 Tax=Scylla paramamosain TaxID=85552 RepID=A0AAW0T927_SCYPA